MIFIKFFYFDIKLMDIKFNNVFNLIKKKYYHSNDKYTLQRTLLCFLFRKIDYDICIKYNIDKKFSFDNLKNLNKEQLYNQLYNTDDYIIHVLDILKLNEKIYTHIEKNLLYDIFNMLKGIDSFNGFKNINLKNYINLNNNKPYNILLEYLFTKIDPEYNETIYDGCCGIGYNIIKYIDHCLDNNIEIIPNNIYLSDINDYNINIMSLYVFLYKGITDMNVKIKNSLKNIDNVKYDNIIMYPPTGLYNLNDYRIDKSLLFLHHSLHKLNDNGECCIILPYNFINNNREEYRSTIKFLTENYNLESVYVIKLLNKNNIIFHIKNNGITKNIKYIDLRLNNSRIYENNNYEIKIDKLITNNYKLEYDFNPFRHIIFPSHIIKEELNNLLDIISVPYDIMENNIIENNININNLNEIENNINKIENNRYEIVGDYRYVNKFYNTFNCYENDIIINKYYGNIYKFPYKTFVSKKYCYILRVKKNINNINIDYIYNYLYNNKNLLCLLLNNSNKRHSYKNNLKKLPIPLIPLDNQNTIVNYIKLNNSIIKTLNNTITNLQNSNSNLFNEITSINIV